MPFSWSIASGSSVEATDRSRVDRLERFEQWADAVQPEDLAIVSSDGASPVAAPDEVGTAIADNSRPTDDALD